MEDTRAQAKFYNAQEAEKQLKRVRDMHIKVQGSLAQYTRQLLALRQLNHRLQTRLARINERDGFEPSFYGAKQVSKNVWRLEQNAYRIGLTTALGQRATNEDCAYVSNKGFFCAVFDGHCGAEAAQCAHDNIDVLFSRKCADLITSLRLNALELDTIICAECADAGCTFGFAGAFDGCFCVGNVGDVRVVGPTCATVDHKPLAEEMRLMRYGSEVLRGRVNAVLATSRAFGDAQMKIQGVVAQIDIHILERPEPWIVIASDGLWDVLSTELVRTLVEAAIANEPLSEEDVKMQSEDVQQRDPPESQPESLKKAFLCYLTCHLPAGDAFMQRVRGIRVYPMSGERLELPSAADGFETRVAKALTVLAFRLGSQDNITCVFANSQRVQ